MSSYYLLHRLSDPSIEGMYLDHYHITSNPALFPDSYAVVRTLTDDEVRVLKHGTNEHLSLGSGEA